MNMNIIDIDRWQEIWMTITRNKTRSLLTAFGVFWGIFMLVALIGGGNGLQNMMSRSFSGIATNSCFFMSQHERGIQRFPQRALLELGNERYRHSALQHKRD